jgi:hypothetical protein
MTKGSIETHLLLINWWKFKKVAKNNSVYHNSHTGMHGNKLFINYEFYFLVRVKGNTLSRGNMQLAVQEPVNTILFS